METKHCKRCDQTKPKEEFHPNRGSKDGVQTYCRVCLLAYRKARYAANREVEYAKIKAWQRANREKYLAYHRKSDAKRRAARRQAREGVGVENPGESGSQKAVQWPR